MQETPQQYTQRILGNVEGQDPLRVQRATPAKLAKMVRGLDRKKLATRPAPGKWCIAEILAHLADAELVSGWRMRLILGENGVSIKPFDQDVWATRFNYRRRDPKVSLETFRVLREGNLALLKSVPKELWENYGMHEERGKESIGHIVRMFAGHDLNHLRQVEGLARQKPKSRGRSQSRRKK
jgi:DinB superfamily